MFITQLYIFFFVFHGACNHSFACILASIFRNLPGNFSLHRDDRRLATCICIYLCYVSFDFLFVPCNSMVHICMYVFCGYIYTSVCMYRFACAAWDFLHRLFLYYLWTLFYPFVYLQDISVRIEQLFNKTSYVLLISTVIYNARRSVFTFLNKLFSRKKHSI